MNDETPEDNQEKSGSNSSNKGNVKHIDEGRFPLLSMEGNTHQWYQDKGELELLQPPDEQLKKIVKWYLNTTNDERKKYKLKRVEVRSITQNDIDAIGGSNQVLIGQDGIFAKVQLEPGDLLGIYEGILLLSNSELAARAGPQNINKVADYGWRFPWEASEDKTQFDPILSSYSTPSDQNPIGCLLAYVNTALTPDGNYDDKLINIEPTPVLTHIGKGHGLMCDSVAYVVTKRVNPGEQLFITYGAGQKEKLSSEN